MAAEEERSPWGGVFGVAISPEIPAAICSKVVALQALPHDLTHGLT